MSFLFYNFSFGFPFFRFRKCLFLPIIPLFYLFACQETDIPHKTQHTQHHQTDTSKTTSLPASTQEMVNELRHIALNPNNKDMWYLNEQKAKKYEAMLPQLTNTPNQWINTAYQAATQWLNAGNYNHAIELLDQTFAFIKTQNVQLQQNEINTLLEVKAISFMRKGEIENCLHNHNEYSCLLPIEGPGQHLNKTGSQSALHIYEQLLQYDPDNPQNKWLYNIAHMTLSSYPHDVDKKHLIPPGVFHSEANFPRFTDIAMPLGIAVNDISGSVILDDFNNDHYLDIIASSYGLQDQLRYFQNDGHGGFTDKTQEAGLMGLWSGLNLKQADYNNDGWMDILVLRGAWMGAQGKHPNSLLLNQGNGTFRDVTKEAGLYSLFPTQTAAWGDFDNDGWLDLFIANESSRFISAPCLLFHNNGDGTFSEIAASMGLNKTGFFKGCAWGDINNDGWLDLYLSNLTGKNLLFLNNGKGTAFQDISLSAGISEPNFSFPCWFFDYNQDGWEDIFVSGFDIRQFETAAGEVAKDYLGLPTTAEKPRLYRNNRNNTFTDVSKELHLDKVLYTMGCNY
ncbi:MAG TPA: VCBS repeat-containing protein, partial [Phaeodactylibacter sp.]|nr:VCBS repeat-containing protein [Phaeodactylibacter sp.]